jgi:hypothetical protein
MTDPGCLILFVLLVAATGTLFAINFFSGKMVADPPITQLGFFSLLSLALTSSLTETIISCSCLVAFGFIIMGVVLLLPIVAGFFIIISCLGVLCFVLFTLLNKGYIQVFD